MDLIFINDHKLKIMLSGSDMKEYSLDCDALDYESTKTQSIFRNILNKAKEDTGFDSEGGRVFIQLYPSKEGGCEMYVTKLGGLTGRRGAEDGAAKKTVEGKRECAYSFENLENLLAVCRRLSSLGYSEKSSAWRLPDRYCLLINEPEENAYIPVSECSFIREYGKSESARNTGLLIAERGKCICAENAIDTLACF